MNRFGWAGLMLAVALLVVSSTPAGAQEFQTRLSGFQEVGGVGAGQTGAILSTGEGTLKMKLDKNAQNITYELTYSDLTAVTQAHIHFGKRHVGGGIMVFFCSNLGTGPAGTPVCPAAGGTVTGMFTAASVVGPAAQNVTAGDFNALVAALNSNTTYANIHTTKFPAGEIRGQIHRDSFNRDHHDSHNDRNDHDGHHDSGRDNDWDHKH